MRIVFMGTPDFARTILERLVADGHEVCGVFTQPDKPRNRNKVTPSPVKEYALTQNIPVFQPVTMRDGTALEDLKALAPDLAVVAAYGRILPEEILFLPPMGCINVHASILPKYRGAAPINWAILNGDKETGVTIMHMAKECDAGDMILVKKQPIRPDETAEELFSDLAALGADAISEAIEQIRNGTAQRVPQNEAEATKCGMIKKEYGHIDFSRGKDAVHNLVRGMNPWPCAYAMLEGEAVKIWKTRHSDAEPSRGELGLILRADRFNGILVDCGDGVIEILELQFPGAKRMDAASAVLGHKMGFKVFE